MKVNKNFTCNTKLKKWVSKKANKNYVWLRMKFGDNDQTKDILEKFENKEIEVSIRPIRLNALKVGRNKHKKRKRV